MFFFFFFLSFIFIFGFCFGLWFCVFLSRYSRGAWCFVLVGVGLGLGYIQHRENLPSTDWTIGTCYLFLLMRWEEGW